MFEKVYTDEQKKKAIELKKQGKSYKEIAALTGIKYLSVSGIVNRRKKTDIVRRKTSIRKKYTQDQIQKAVELAKKGYSHKYIERQTGIYRRSLPWYLKHKNDSQNSSQMALDFRDTKTNSRTDMMLTMLKSDIPEDIKIKVIKILAEA
jgi:orotate phosphoribosyltransferase-like protein